MAEPFQDVGIEWKEWGYANSPGPKFARRRGDDPGWDTWVKVLQEAKAGNFRGVKQLLPIFENTEDPVLNGVCGMLLGDAGTPDCYDAVIAQLPSVEDSEPAQDRVDILTARGRLADVPLMVQTYQEFAEDDEAEFFAYDLSEILSPDMDFVDDPDSFSTPARYAAAVLKRYRAVSTALGGDQHYAFKGALFSVPDLARGLVNALREPDDFSPTPWRRKFEAATGIDCSSFYKDGMLQPLTATALVEEFLNSPAVNNFKPDVRYFFGHRLPD